MLSCIKLTFCQMNIATQSTNSTYYWEASIITIIINKAANTISSIAWI